MTFEQTYPMPENRHAALAMLVSLSSAKAELFHDKQHTLHIHNVINACETLLGPVQGSYCGAHCGWSGPHPGINTIEDLYDRLVPGRETPTGQCPECGKLTFSQKDAGYVG